MSGGPSGGGSIALPPFGRGARIVLTVLWGTYIAWLVCSIWLHLPWASGSLLWLDPVEATLGLRPWQFVTYWFLHASPLWLILDSLILWWFGSDLEARWGTAPFLRFCLWMIGAGGIGALVALPLRLLGGDGSLLAELCGPLTGSTTVLLGLTAAWATIYPDRSIYLFFLLPVKGRWLIPLGIAIELLLLLALQNTLTHIFASLAAVALAYLLVTGKWRVWRNRGKSAPRKRSSSFAGLKVIRGGRDVDDDEDDDEPPPDRPRYLN